MSEEVKDQAQNQEAQISGETSSKDELKSKPKKKRKILYFAVIIIGLSLLFTYLGGVDGDGKLQEKEPGVWEYSKDLARWPSSVEKTVRTVVNDIIKATSELKENGAKFNDITFLWYVPTDDGKGLFAQLFLGKHQWDQIPADKRSNFNTVARASFRWFNRNTKYNAEYATYVQSLPAE